MNNAKKFKKVFDITAEDIIDYDRLERSVYAAVYQAIKSVEGDHLREV